VETYDLTAVYVHLVSNHALLEGVRDHGEPPAQATFPLFSNELPDSGHNIASDRRSESFTPTDLVVDVKGMRSMFNILSVGHIDHRTAITLDTEGEPSLDMQLELESHLPPLHYLPSPDRKVVRSSDTTAGPYVVRRHQLTLDTVWNKEAADLDEGIDESGNASLPLT
jgi:hypothetical protein